jgi:hypothetical protein
MISMRKEFESILASNLDFLFKNGRPETRPAFPALLREAALDGLDPVPLDSWDFSEALSAPDAESFGSLLEEKLQSRLEDCFGRNLPDSVISIAETQICNESRSCGNDEREISVAF